MFSSVFMSMKETFNLKTNPYWRAFRVRYRLFAPLLILLLRRFGFDMAPEQPPVCSSRL